MCCLYILRVYMNTAVINFRIDLKVKKQAQAVAEELGMNLSTLLNGYIKHLVRTQRVEFDLNGRNSTQYIDKIIQESKKYD